MGFGIALAGGGARGAAHVGVLLALEEAGMAPTAIAGTSAGGIVAGLYAAGLSAVRLQAVVHDLTQHGKRLIDPNYLGLIKAAGQFLLRGSISLSGLLKGRRLEELLRTLTGGKSLHEARMRTVIPAVDLQSGYTIAYVDRTANTQPVELVHWSDDALLCEAMRASAAFPVVFEPVKRADLCLIDGGVADNLPVNLLAAAGEPDILAVNIAEHYRMPVRDNVIEIASHTLSIMQERLLSYAARGEKLMLRPRLPEQAGLLTFDQMDACMEAGYEATVQMLPSIRTLLAPSHAAAAR